MTVKSITERRRIVYSALARYFKADRLFEALWLWEQKYATTNSLEIRKYVSEVINEEDPEELKSKVYKSLTKATYFTVDSDLLPDPYEEMQKYRERISDSFKYISAHVDNIPVSFATVVFEQVLRSFLTQLKRRDTLSFEKIAYQLITRLSSLEGKATNKLELKNWLMNKTNSLRLHYPESFMRDFVNELYVVCCEAYGPIISDKFLSSSIKSADDLDEARFFDSKRLL